MNKAKRAAVIAGNWKMNMTPAKTTAFMKELAPKVAGLDDCKIVLCVPFVDIAAAVEAMFKGTKVKSVNTMNMKPKTRRVRYVPGKTAAWKKAIVTLTEDSETIEFFEGMN